MLGAICGDVIGRPFEFRNFVLNKEFELFSEQSRFSDDTVMTVAVADAILNDIPFEDALVKHGRTHMDCGFGKMFFNWLLSDERVQGTSWGNGSAMRVGAIAWLARDLDHAIKLATHSTLPSHASYEGVTSLGPEGPSFCALRR